jgi:hypothetical protein
MSTRNRIGNKWTVNEVLSLQREYELLGWDIDQIAEKHGRTANAIMYKLDQDGFADYNVLFSNYHYHSSNNEKMSVSRTQKPMSLEPSLSDDDDTVVDDENDEDYVDDGEEEDNPWDEDEDDEDPLTERVSKLESGLDEIKHMLKMLTSSVHGLSQATSGSNNVKYGSYGVPRGVDF